ncbi:MAG TPA: hypothetical protein VJ717_03660 [Gemmatimonadaceae bacterium]|nr:hypothetical protein [Gemmatimonadaceae bacterium]
MTATRVLLRHTLATLAYRAAKAVRGAPDSFADWRAGSATRTPIQILAHMGDLMDWALQLAQGKQVWREAAPLPWPDEVARFFTAIKKLDDYLATEQPLGCEAERLFQGPVADALTHTGQLTMLRGLAGSPVRGENYAKADITTGTVGLEQAPPRREF